MIEQNLPTVFGACMLLVCVFFTFEWLQDILFYKRNNWDFSKDSGRNYFYVGEFATEPESAVVRLKFGFPFMIVIALLLGVYFTFFYV